MTTLSPLDTSWWFRHFLFGMLVGFYNVFSYEVEIQPKNGPLFIKAGNSLELNCTVTHKDLSGLDGAQLLSWKFWKNGTAKEMQSSIVDENISTLFIDEVSVSHTGTYTCYFNKTQWNYRKVYVGYPPNPPDDFYCVSHDYLDLICKWKVSESEYAENWTLSYKSWWSGVVNKSPKCLNKHVCSYHWPSDGRDLYGLFEPFMVYDIEIVGTSRFGNTSFKKYIDPEKRVKMSALRHVNVQYSHSTSLRLLWQLSQQSEGLPSIFDIIYRIFYKSKWDNEFKQATKIMQSSTPTNSVTMTLTDLVPNTQYNISVSAKIVNAVGERYWSDPFIMTGKTGYDVPGALPEFTISSYQLPQQSNTIKIYLKPLPERMKNSPFVNYSLTFDELDKNGEIVSSETRVYPESPMLHPDVELNLNHEYKIKILVLNEIGPADKTGILRLPYLFSDYPRPDYVMVEKDSLNSRYLISWFKDNVDTLDVATVTYYWCKKWTGDNVCHENLNWSIESSNTTSMTINIDDAENFDKWIFGVSMEMKDNVSSGIFWENCQFPYFDQVDDIPAPNFFTVRKNEKALEVKITGYCNILNGNLLKVRPDNYTIIYGVVAENITVNLVQEAQRDDRTIILPDLEPYTQYFVTMRTGTRAGYSEFSSKIIVRTDMIAPSTPPREIKAENITGSSFTVTWGTTENPNGPIISYEITLKVSVRDIKSVQQVTSDVFSYTFNNLDGYTNYTALIRACNEVDCSSAGSVYVLTSVKAPEGLNFELEKIADNQIGILIQGPEKPNAPEYFYGLKLTKIDQNLEVIGTEYNNVTEKIIKFNFSCTDNTISVKLAVDAIGKDEDGNLYQPPKKFLQEKEINICPAAQKTPDMFPAIVGSISAVLIFILIFAVGFFIHKKLNAYFQFDPEIAEVKMTQYQDQPGDYHLDITEIQNGGNVELPEIKDDNDNIDTLGTKVNENGSIQPNGYVLVDENGQPLNDSTPPDQKRMVPGSREGEITIDNLDIDIVVIDNNEEVIMHSSEKKNVINADSELKHDIVENFSQNNQNHEHFVPQISDDVTQDHNNQETVNHEVQLEFVGMYPVPRSDYIDEADIVNTDPDVNRHNPEISKSPAIELNPLRNNLTLESTNNAELTQHVDVVPNSEENDKISSEEDQNCVTDYVTNQFPFLITSPNVSGSNHGNTVSDPDTESHVNNKVNIDGLTSDCHSNNNMSESVIDMNANRYSNNEPVLQNQSSSIDLNRAGNSNSVTDALSGSGTGTDEPPYYRTKGESLPMETKKSDSVTGSLPSSGTGTDESSYYRTHDETLPHQDLRKFYPVTHTLSDESPYYRLQDEVLSFEPDQNFDKSDARRNCDFEVDNPSKTNHDINIDTHIDFKHSYDSSENQQKHDDQKTKEIKNENRSNTDQEHYIKLQRFNKSFEILKQISVVESDNGDSSISPVSTLSRSSVKDPSETENLDTSQIPTSSVDQTVIPSKHINEQLVQNLSEDPYISAEQANQISAALNRYSEDRKHLDSNDAGINHDLESYTETEMFVPHINPDGKSDIIVDNDIGKWLQDVKLTVECSSPDMVSQGTPSPTTNLNQLTNKHHTDHDSCQVKSDNGVKYKLGSTNAIELSTVANDRQLQSVPDNTSPVHRTDNINNQSVKSPKYHVTEQSLSSNDIYLQTIQNSNYVPIDDKRTRQKQSHLHKSAEDSPYVSETSFISTSPVSNSLDLNSNPLPGNSIQNNAGYGYVSHSQLSIA